MPAVFYFIVTLPGTLDGEGRKAMPRGRILKGEYNMADRAIVAGSRVASELISHWL